MATKVYESGYMLVVDDTATAGITELVYVNKAYTTFGFDGDVCRIKDLGDTDEYIYNDLSENMADIDGFLIGDRDAVEAYLLGILGSGAFTEIV